MVKLYVRIMLTFCILVIAIPLIIFAYVQIKLHILETKTTHYLLIGRGINKEAIKSVKSVKSVLSKAPIFSINVIYKDEPEVTYYYQQGDDGSIFQNSHSYYGQHYTYKHIEKK